MNSLKRNFFWSIKSLIFLLVMILSFSFMLDFNSKDDAVYAATVQYSGTSGSCGWSIDDTGLLRIYPSNGTSGTLKSGSSTSSWGWYNYNYNVKKVVIENGVYTNTNASYMLYNLYNCTEMDLSGLNTINTTNMSNMLANCSSVVELDLSSFNTSSVTNMSYMVAYNSALERLNVSSFNTNNVTNMNYMFASCRKLNTIVFGNNFKFVGTSHSFTNSVVGDGWVKKYNLDGTATNNSTLYTTAEVTALTSTTTPTITGRWIKFGTEVNKETGVISGICGTSSWEIDTNGVLRIYPTDGLSGTLNNISSNSSTSIDVAPWYNYRTSVKKVLIEGNVSANTSLAYAFYGMSNCTEMDLSNLDINDTTSLKCMFQNNSALTYLDISNFNTANVTDMQYMFSGCSKLLTIGLSNNFTFSGNHSFQSSTVNDGWIKVLNLDGTFTNDIAEFTATQLTELSATTSPTIGGFWTRYNIVVDAESNTITGTSGTCSWKIDANGVLRIYPTNGESGTLSNMTNSTMVPWYEYRTSVKKLIVEDGVIANSALYATFYGMTNCTEMDLSGLDVTNVTTMRSMFNSCSKLTSLDLSNFAPANIESMYRMFYYCSKLTDLNLSGFNTSDTTDMGEMLTSCNSLSQITVSDDFDFSANHGLPVTTNWTKTKNVDGSDTNNATTYRSDKWTALTGTTIPTVGGTWQRGETYTSFVVGTSGGVSWELDKGTGLLKLFPTDGISGTLANNTSNNSSFWSWYSQSSSVKKVKIENGVIGNSSLYYMFYNMSNCTEMDLSGLDTSNVTNMDGMFYYCSKLTNLDLSNFDTSNVISMQSMFYVCSALKNLNLESFNTANVTSMTHMFENCSSLENLDLSNFNTGSITDISNMFSNSNSLKALDLSNFDVSNVTKLRDDWSGYGPFAGCSSLTSLNLSGWTNDKIDNISYLFSDLTNLQELNLTNFNTLNITSMDGLFNNCSSLTSLDLSNFNTGNVTNMYGMFMQCSSLTSLDLSSFDTSNITSMENMFYGCSKLTSLNLSSFNTTNVLYMNNMFRGNTELKEIVIGDNFTFVGSNHYFDSSTNGVGGAWAKTHTPNGIAIDSIALCSADAMSTLKNSNTKPTLAGKWVRLTTLSEGAYATVIYDANGGGSFSNGGTKNVVIYEDAETIKYGRYEDLICAKNNAKFLGWYTNEDCTKGNKFDIATLSADITVYAKYGPSYTVIYDANGCGTFSNENTQNVVTYESDLVTEKRVSKTSNVNNDGSTNSTKYPQVANGVTDTITIEGATELKVTITYSTNYIGSDWVCVYDGSIIPSTSNYNSSISGKLGDQTKTTKTYIVPGDTVQFFFRADYSRTGYGYYATVEAKQSVMNVNSEAYEDPKPNPKFNFQGWYTDATCTEGNEFDINNLTSDITVYAKYEEVAVLYSGTCGGCSWAIYENGTLLIWPTNGESGTLLSNSNNVSNFWPWYQYRDSVKNATIKDGVIPNYSISYMFAYCKNLETLNLGIFNTNDVIKMASMFEGCNSLTELDLNGFSTINVTSMEYMFQNCSSLTSLDLSNFDTSKVTNMHYMFDGCSSLTSLDLSSFNTNKVTSMGGMFSGCSSLTSLDLSSFDTANVKYNGSYYSGSMMSMFNGCSSLQTLDINNFDTSNVTTMHAMFSECSGLTSLDLSSLDTSNVTNMSYMFDGCEGLTSLDLSNFDTSNVTTMERMFYNCSSLTELDLSSFNTNNVTNMSAMFQECRSLTELDLSNFDTSNVTTFGNRNSSSYTGGIFYRCNNLTTLNLSNWSNDKITNMSYLFLQLRSLTTLNLTNFKTNNATNMESMFSDCSNLISLDLSYFDTSKVTNMSGMFGGCNSLTSLDVNSFNTSSVTDMSSMFYCCVSLTNLDLSNFDTSKVTTMQYMFGSKTSLGDGCKNLTSLDLSSFNTSKVTNMENMFYGCKKIMQIKFSDKFKFVGTNHSFNNSSSYSVGGANWVKVRNADGSKTYDYTIYTATQISALNNTNSSPLLGGTWSKGGSDAYIINPDGSVEYISEDAYWDTSLDNIWTYSFSVFDDSMLFYLYEEIIEGYTSEAMYPYYITIYDNMGTITNTKTESVVETGKLVISKTVEGTETNDKFEFVITLNGDNIQGNQIFNDVIFKNGVSKVFLKHGESKTFDLPVGTNFHVAETANVQYSSTVSNADGTIIKNETVSIQAVNTYIEQPTPETGKVNVSIKKTVEGCDDSLAKFIISGYFNNLKANETYEVSNGKKIAADASGNGFCNLEIGINEEIVIYNIPAGAVYQFTEQAGEYIASYSIINNAEGGDSTIVKKNGENGSNNTSLSTAKEVADADEDILITFHNRFETIQKLTVAKLVKEELEDGSYSIFETDEEFEFNIKFFGMNEGDSFSSTIGKIIADEYGEAYKTFYLKNGESVEFYNTPVGVEYVIEESANNYKPTYLATGLGVIKSTDNGSKGHSLSTGIEALEANEVGSVTFTNLKVFPRNKAVQLIKSIDAQNNPNIVEALQHNAMYHLEGAEYQLIIDGEAVETLVTNNKGEAVSTQTFANGTTGIIKEVKAPDGFLLNETEYSFTIDGSDEGTYCKVFVSDVPAFDPTVIMVQKKDSVTGTIPQGSASFEGAVFKYEYYDNTDWSGIPERTWYFKTNAMGLHGYHPNYLADDYTSHELYTSGNNVYMIPLGSIKITEVVSPAGYKTMPVLYATITQDSMGANARWRFTQETLEFLTTGTDGLYEGIEPIDEEKFGSLVVQKAVNESGFAKPTDDATFAGCEFTIYNKSTNPVKIGENEITQPGEACMVITVGADGKATSGAVLPVGTYEVKETKGNEFYQCNTAWSYTFTVDGTEDNPVFNTTCENDAVIFTQNITLKKVVSNPDVLFGNEVFTINVEFSGLEVNKIYNMSNGKSFTSDASGCATYTARIAHNEEVVFQDIPVGANYKFTEIAGQYTASYSIVDSNKE